MASSCWVFLWLPSVTHQCATNQHATRRPASTVENFHRRRMAQVVETLSRAGADMTARNAAGLDIHQRLGQRE